MTRHKVDCVVCALYGKKGLGKSTLAVALAIEYALRYECKIISNMKLTIPSVETVRIIKISELLEYLQKNVAPAVVLVDEFDKGFSSNQAWIAREHDQKLSDLMSNVRRFNIVAFIATAQGRRKIRNTFRMNCDYVIEPVGQLDAGECPEYFVWDDPELYEESGRGRYLAGREPNVELIPEFCACSLPLFFLDKCFNTRDTVPPEWD